MTDRRHQVSWACPKCRQFITGLDDIQRHRNPWLKLCPAMRPKKTAGISRQTTPPVQHGTGIVKRIPHAV